MIGVTKQTISNLETKNADLIANGIPQKERLSILNQSAKDQVELLYSKESTDEDFKECPVCLELVRSKAKICRYCGHKF